MTDMIMAALPGERVIESNRLATVTTNCLIVRNMDGRSRTIIPLSYLSRIKTTTTTYPGLLVICIGLFVISAGAFCSKHQRPAAISVALAGIASLAGYIGYRRASISFIVRFAKTSTAEGRPKEVVALIKAIQFAQVGDAYPLNCQRPLIDSEALLAAPGARPRQMFRWVSRREPRLE